MKRVAISLIGSSYHDIAVHLARILKGRGANVILADYEKGEHSIRDYLFIPEGVPIKDNTVTLAGGIEYMACTQALKNHEADIVINLLGMNASEEAHRALKESNAVLFVAEEDAAKLEHLRNISECVNDILSQSDSKRFLIAKNVTAISKHADNELRGRLKADEMLRLGFNKADYTVFKEYEFCGKVSVRKTSDEYREFLYKIVCLAFGESIQKKEYQKMLKAADKGGR